MIRILYFLFSVMFAVSATAQNYKALWKLATEYGEKDLPQSEIGTVRQIQSKAKLEKNYGQLLKSEMRELQLLCAISPDSLNNALLRLKTEEKSTDDKVLNALYSAVLYKVVHDNISELCNREADAKAAKAEYTSMMTEYRQKALAHPDLLAAKKCNDYEPFTVQGNIGKYFLNDLLSAVGYEVGDFETLHAYYEKKGLRGAALLTELKCQNADDLKNNKYYGSPYKLYLDSLELEYSDLPVCGEVAIERLNFMRRCADVTVKDEIDQIHHALNRWADYERMNLLRNEEAEFIRPHFEAQLAKRQSYSDERQTLQLNYLRNISQFTVTIHKTSLANSHETANTDTEKGLSELKKKITGTAFATTRSFYGHAEYESFKDTIQLGSLAPGVYLIECSAPKVDTDYKILYVSDVSVAYQNLPQGKVRIAVLNAKTGQPVGSAKVDLKYGSYQNAKTETRTVDEKGEIILDSSSLSEIYAYTETDKYSLPVTVSGQYRFYGQNAKTQSVCLYTDRAIYRPGQTVKASAIVFTREGDSTEVVSNAEVKFMLRDANHEIVEEKTSTTDAYGTAAADFLLPKNGLTGNFYLYADKHSASFASFKVEEYKRPTFEIVFPEITKKYQNGDTLLVHTKVLTFAGAPVQNAKVKYQTVRRPAYGIIWGEQASAEVMQADSAMTDANGAFWLKMNLDLPKGNSRVMYNFETKVIATSLNGETHEATLTVPLGYKKALLEVNLPSQIERDSLRTMTFNMKNAAGHDVDAEVRYWFDNDQEHTCQTQQQIAIVPQLASGKHELTAICEDDTLKQSVLVFTEDDTKPCCPTKDWFWVSSSTFPRDGKPVTVQVGSSDENLHILYSIFAKDKVIEQGSVKENASLLNRKFTYKEEYGDGLVMSFYWLKDGVSYVHTAKISKPYPEKTLKLQWSTFRDRLSPGQKEEWQLKIIAPDLKPADAQLMCTLYDKSLDAFTVHDWNLQIKLPRNLPYNTEWRKHGDWGLSFYSYAKYSPLTSHSIEWPGFDGTLFSTMRYKVYSSGSMRLRGATSMASSKSVLQEVAVVKDAIDTNSYETSMALEGTIAGLSISENEGQAEPVSNVQVRENLNETAFFYPQLIADKDGQVAIRFTLPESLTSWKFIGLAHTKDMCYGKIEDEIVARKDLMVQPNVPRFVRMGDMATVSAAIINMSDKDMSGVAYMELIDPETEKIVFSKNIKFTVAEGQTESVTFEVSTDKLAGQNPQLLICKVYAIGKDFSDGEQHYLPILADKEMVMNTIPVTQHEAGDKTVDLKQLVPDGMKNAKLTVEYTNNPAWLIVQSLPSIAAHSDDDVISNLQAYYSSCLASNFLNSTPRLKNIIKAWANEPAESLKSKLMQNEDVKNILLSETPWVYDATTENDWMQQLVNYYDENAVNQRIASALDKMEELQLNDGSWTWFKGMQGNFYITLSVVEHLARLNMLTGQQDNMQMITKGMRWMSKETNKMVAKMKEDEAKGNKQYFPGGITLQYLYACAISECPLDKETQSANDYLIALLKKDVQKRSIFEKGLSAIILHKHGEKSLAQEYVKSLKEYSVYTEEMGRYYDTERAGYTWRDYRIPTEVSAIEAIACVTPTDRQTIEEMQRWLLQEKRTQFWATPLNCMDAVYAFMLGNSSALDAKENAEIRLDNKRIEFTDKVAGLGYVKKSMNYGNEKKLTFSKTTEGTSWGAVYAQFLQPVKDIAAASSGITVTRTIDKKGTLKVGDKVKVTITIRADRDYDFVQITDKRAACMEPVQQLSGQHWGYYISPKDSRTDYFVLMLSKGVHKIETEYYVDRAGTYQYGPTTVQCAYSPEFTARSNADIINVH